MLKTHTYISFTCFHPPAPITAGRSDPRPPQQIKDTPSSPPPRLCGSKNPHHTPLASATPLTPKNASRTGAAGRLGSFFLALVYLIFSSHTTFALAFSRLCCEPGRSESPPLLYITAHSQMLTRSHLLHPHPSVQHYEPGSAHQILAASRQWVCGWVGVGQMTGDALLCVFQQYLSKEQRGNIW